MVPLGDELLDMLWCSAKQISRGCKVSKYLFGHAVRAQRQLNVNFPVDVLWREAALRELGQALNKPAGGGQTCDNERAGMMLSDSLLQLETLKFSNCSGGKSLKNDLL